MTDNSEPSHQVFEVTGFKQKIVVYPPHNTDGRSSRRFLFGPVPSRRLGLSLGIDLVPAKTCTLDCLYCEVGRTTTQTVDRFRRDIVSEVVAELHDFLADKDARLDYITLAGSGEPTLNEDIGPLISTIKALTDVPVAVLTNGTLLFRSEVRKDLIQADVVIPSLDTINPLSFRRINQPHPDLDLDQIVDGLFAFREEYRGRLCLEVLLVKGINDRPGELHALRSVIDRLKPDQVQLNTVFRPPAYPGAKALTSEELAAAARILGPLAETTTSFCRERHSTGRPHLWAQIMALLTRRPCAGREMAESLGASWEQVQGTLANLARHGLIQVEIHDGQEFYRRTPIRS